VRRNEDDQRTEPRLTTKLFWLGSRAGMTT